MKARWITSDKYVGPGNRHLAISKGETRRVVWTDGKRAVLEGKNGKGFFGSVCVSNLKMISDKEESLV